MATGYASTPTGTKLFNNNVSSPLYTPKPSYQVPMTQAEREARARSQSIYTGATTGGGSVLGTSTVNNPAPTPNVSSTPTFDPSAQIRSDINAGYDSYFGELDNMLNVGLPSQRAAQESIANSQYDQGINQLDTQRNLGIQDLNAQRTKADANQSKTLADLTNNIRNLFQSGNVYLGARGASDSSAANQYSYALTKLGSQQRGDVTAQYADIHNDIDGRESRLNEIYNGEVKNQGLIRDQQIAGIAQWFGEQQNALRQAKAQGQLSKGQDLASLSKDLLNVALQHLQNVETESINRKSALDQWAMNHATDINQLKSNLAQVSNVNYQTPTTSALGAIGGGGSSNVPSLFGYGNSNEKSRNGLFG